MATTALGAIPGGALMYALSAQILMEQGAYKGIGELAADTMALFGDGASDGELRLDTAYQACLDEFNERKDALLPSDVPECFVALYE
jgi:enoyl-[acyl-carrier protein] reductase/trans-2-enoyl-CoA reductase (NAD+)